MCDFMHFYEFCILRQILLDEYYFSTFLLLSTCLCTQKFIPLVGLYMMYAEY
jgi:hypothetical protein